MRDVQPLASALYLVVLHILCPVALYLESQSVIHLSQPGFTLSLCSAFVGMTLLTLAIALIAGMVLNDKYFGSATGGGDAEGTAEEQEETAGNIDALKIFCCSWAVAMVLAMARLLVIWKVNGRYRRIYNFVVFLVLSFAVLDLSWSLVGERQIAVLEPASPAMISQVAD